MTSRRRRVLSGLLAIALVFALLEGLASLAYVVWWARMHWWRPLPERAHTEYDPELGWVNVKGRVTRDVFGPGLDVTTNALGFRATREYANAVPAQRRRVLALGDSFTFGYGVGDADAWPAWLEKLCPELEVPNMGQSGYGIDQSWLWYRRDAAELEHDVLVLAFIDDDLRRVQVDEMAGYGKPVLELLDGRLRVTNVPVPRAAYLVPALTQNVALLGTLRLVELPRELLAHFGAAPAPRRELRSEAEAAENDAAVFAELAAESARRGATLVLVHLPRLATDAPDRLQELPQFGVTAIERARDRGIPFADLVDEMGPLPDAERRELFQAESLRNGPGGHYSPAGNRFVALAIARRLVRLGLIPAGACAEL
jgi:hypothetical protein